MREKDASPQEMVRLLLRYSFYPLQKIRLYGLTSESLCDRERRVKDSTH